MNNRTENKQLNDEANHFHSENRNDHERKPGTRAPKPDE